MVKTKHRGPITQPDPGRFHVRVEGDRRRADIAREIGADVSDGYVTTGEIIESIADAFKKKAHTKPMLIIDQANSLKPAALRTLIHLFNECEDILGLVVLGTENLEVEIKRSVRYKAKFTLISRLADYASIPG